MNFLTCIKKNIFHIIFDIMFSLYFIKVLVYNFALNFNFIQFVLIFIIYLNCWTIQTVHLNRYGKNSFINNFFVALQILLYYFVVNKNHFELKYSLATLVLISVIFSIQHITEYILTDSKKLILKKITEPFCYIHTGRTLALLLGFYFIDYAYHFIFIAFSISQLFPSFISRSLHAKDINFKSLTLRLTQLVTILSTFTLLNNFSSLNQHPNIWLSISNLFIIIFIISYNISISKLDLTLTKQSGNTYILGTYFILFGFFLTAFSSNIYYMFITILCFYIGYISYKQYKKS